MNPFDDKSKPISFQMFLPPRLSDRLFDSHSHGNMWYCDKINIDFVIPMIAIGLKILCWFLVVFILNIVGKKVRNEGRLMWGEVRVLAGHWSKLVLLRSYWAPVSPAPPLTVPQPPPPPPSIFPAPAGCKIYGGFWGLGMLGLTGGC